MSGRGRGWRGGGNKRGGWRGSKGAVPPSTGSDDEGDGWQSAGIKIHDFSKSLKLREYAEERPMWVVPDRRVFLESFADPKIYEKARDFLVAIAEPVSRPTHIHEYKITKQNLYAAASMGITGSAIARTLRMFSKTEVPPSVIAFVRKHAGRYGRVKLVLQGNKYFVMAPKDIIKLLDQDEEIHKHRTDHEEDLIWSTEVEAEQSVRASGIVSAPPTAGSAGATGGGGGAGSGPVRDARSGESSRPSTLMEKLTATMEASGEVDSDDELAVEKDAIQQRMLEGVAAVKKDIARSGGDKDRHHTKRMRLDRAATHDEYDDEDEHSQLIGSFEIRRESVDAVRKRCDELNYPVMVEYDCEKDHVLPMLRGSMKKRDIVIRPYQKNCLHKMFGNERARSGIIVLPCGAGKTLVGILATCTVRRSTLILCPHTFSCEQWKEQFGKFTDMPQEQILLFTAKSKPTKETMPTMDKALILITTYSMMAERAHMAPETRWTMQRIKERTWGLMVFDEVHMFPAASFRSANQVVRAHCKLGLTATLVREDELTDDLFTHLVGPKLYEANWMDLTRDGYLANVQCIEVWCPMDTMFYGEYLKLLDTPQSDRRREALYVLNPVKFHALAFLLKTHQKRRDKIIVFSDNVFCLESYAKRLSFPFIHGGTTQTHRRALLNAFRAGTAAGSEVIFLSQVGDVAIDVPEANVIIQVSSHFGSRRQEAQRLGRILRQKKDDPTDPRIPNAFFYTLISTDTAEMHYSYKRRQYLVDQGYAFKVVTSITKDPIKLAQTVRRMWERKYDDDRLLLTRGSRIDLASTVLADEVEETDPRELELISTALGADRRQLNTYLAAERDDQVAADTGERATAPGMLPPSKFGGRASVRRTEGSVDRLSRGGTTEYWESERNRGRGWGTSAKR